MTENKPSVKDRANEQSNNMNEDQQSTIRALANDLHRLNASVMKAVEAGVSVELMRSARHHSGEGAWGDLLTPILSLFFRAAFKHTHHACGRNGYNRQ